MSALQAGSRVGWKEEGKGIREKPSFSIQERWFYLWFCRRGGTALEYMQVYSYKSKISHDTKPVWGVGVFESKPWLLGFIVGSGGIHSSIEGVTKCKGPKYDQWGWRVYWSECWWKCLMIL